MDVFDFRSRLVRDYRDYVESFIQIKDPRIHDYVHQILDQGELWPEPLIQLNPAFETGAWIDELVDQRILHPLCKNIFRRKTDPSDLGRPLQLYQHQTEAIKIAQTGHSYVLTTGTGSGKSLAYIIPIVNAILCGRQSKGIKAIIIYPMNALANSQFGELEKFIHYGFSKDEYAIRFAKYTGEVKEEQRKAIIQNPPDILLTNYVMLELILTRPEERELIRSANNLQFLVLDELHSYRGRQGADVSFLVRRVRESLGAFQLQCIGTSATLAGEGAFHEQKREVARVAGQLFGTEVRPEHVIGETLKRLTPEMDFTKEPERTALIKQMTSKVDFPKEGTLYLQQPLSSWLESSFGVTTDPASGRLVRAKPCSIGGDDGAANKLAKTTGLDVHHCLEIIRRALLAGNLCAPLPGSTNPPFVFRLHQFISRGDTVYASLESENQRKITLYGQQYVPGDREKILLPLAFCRECGQEYYTVYLNKTLKGPSVTPRGLNDQPLEEDQQAGFLYYSTENPWSEAREDLLARVPEEWLEVRAGAPQVRQDRRQKLPMRLPLNSKGQFDEQGMLFYYIQRPFSFCLHCGVSYGSRQKSDFAKLTTLSSEGRSTATTILSMSTIHYLQQAKDLPAKARKLLSFTDNRQDASLQAGHFNDFIEIGVLRAGLYRAVANAGSQGLRHDDLTHAVFQALALSPAAWAVTPGARFAEKENAERAFRNVLGYRLYRDLLRGWRITSPNLEQCGLLEIHYTSLPDLSQAEDMWQGCHAALATASPAVRERILKVLLDFMRRELAIKVDYLTADFQERIQQQNNQYLIAPWALDEDEKMERGAILFPRSGGDTRAWNQIYLSGRSGFGIYLRRPNTLPNFTQKLSLDETEQVIRDLLTILAEAGLVVAVELNEPACPGYQLAAAAMTWHAGDGQRSFHDPIRVPHLPAAGGRPNPYFLHYYREMATQTGGFEAREHTAQVPNELREEREQLFKTAQLPVLYCSPTMELGVDIDELNVVNMRNVPPTPANYAQRSGRAGRSGQPAVVFTYCTTGSPHDQYFFKRPDLMVSGQVAPPRMDLANEDLIKAHIHSVWLAETRPQLGSSLKDILDLSGTEPTLDLLSNVLSDLSSATALERTRHKAEHLLTGIQTELENTDWFHTLWLEEVLSHCLEDFEKACTRWRELYRTALAQAKAQDKVIRDATRPQIERSRAERLRREAESQLKLLTEIENVVQSDFYIYRYFASEGFLPGYSFPRLPLSAYVPGRRLKQHDEFLSRPRFLAISEFGPRAFIYHEGSRYDINRVLLTMQGDELETASAKLCEQCGYLHPVQGGVGPDLCENCHNPLDLSFESLLRLQNVSTRRRDRITSDEEERMRLGYELLTAVRFHQQGGRQAFVQAEVIANEQPLALIKYGHTATIWRINLGWKRRQNRAQSGFLLDIEKGYWEKSENNIEDEEEGFSNRVQRVRPYVEDRRNSMIFQFKEDLDISLMASLQAALKSAIQIEYQLEDQELAVEPLPNSAHRKFILLYEAAEGGAGVLRRLLTDPMALAHVAKRALELCHFDPATGQDQYKAPHAKEICEAACYDCLMGYGNQPDHSLLDRKKIRRLLLALTNAVVKISPHSISREQHLHNLESLAGSDLERKWLHLLEELNLRLPSHAQYLIAECRTRPDFYYQEQYAAVYIDGPHHLFPERRQRDHEQEAALADRGITVIRFGLDEEWPAVLTQYPWIFGNPA